MQYVYDFLTAMWAALFDTGAILETAELMLLGDTVTPAPDLAVGDLTAPNYTTYANAAIAAWVPAVNEEGLPYVTTAPKVFSPTAGTNLPQYIYGAAILDSNGDLVAVDIWDQPLQLTLAGQQLHVTPKLIFGDTNTAVIEAHIE